MHSWHDVSSCNPALLARASTWLACCAFCPAGGAYFKDLASNLLGCFVIGIFAASSVLGLATDRALAILPKGHPWQSNLELQIGRQAGREAGAC